MSDEAIAPGEGIGAAARPALAADPGGTAGPRPAAGGWRLDGPGSPGVRVLVTGASSGLGAAMAGALLEAGATVGAASRPGPRLEAAVAAWRDQGLAAHAVALDVRDPDSVLLAARRAVVDLGGLDMVVNNAGIGMRTVNPRFLEQPHGFFDVTPAQFSDAVATNLLGYFLVARAATLHFLEQGHGRIVNVSINKETMVRSGFAPYGPSRAGSEALSMVMTEDLRPYGIAVNVLLPGGATDTGMIPEDTPAGVRQRLLPASVMGPPVVFLASPEAAGVTGARIVASSFASWLATHRAHGTP